MGKVKISSPWASFYHAINAFFALDPNVKVIYDNDKPEVKLYVDGQDKSDALTELLPSEKEFGNVTLKITVVPSNQLKKSKVVLFQQALESNRAFSFIETIDGVYTNPMHYVLFKREAVQYPDDNLADLYGNRNTLYQELAKEIFGSSDGVFFCTDIDPKL